MSVVIITASSGSNLELAKSFQDKFVEYNVESTIVDLAEMNLPIYSTQAEEKIKNPLHQELLELLDSSTKFVFVAPEYNGATPPSFQNFLAWALEAQKSGEDISMESKLRLLRTVEAEVLTFSCI